MVDTLAKTKKKKREKKKLRCGLLEGISGCAHDSDSDISDSE